MIVGYAVLGGSMTSHPLVLAIAPATPSHLHDHTAELSKAGYRLVAHSHEEATVAEVLRLVPRIILAELGNGERDIMFDLVQRLKAHPLIRHIPLVVYGVGLTAAEIERTSRAGAMWLQLEPADDYKLLAAIRGILRVPEPRPV